MSPQPISQRVLPQRASFVLGFALLATAATLAALIVTRDATATRRGYGRQTADNSRRAPAKVTRQITEAVGPDAPGRARTKADTCRVNLDERRLATLPAAQQEEWRARAAAVETDARKRLDNLTAELGLSAAQRDSMFPVLVRSSRGYDPVMFAGGPAITSAATSAEAVHQVLDPQQKAVVENQEINRQLWWQDTLARLEAGLIGAADGTPAAATTTPPVPADPAPSPTERVAPAAREAGNMFDLLNTNN